jgi:phytoene/squalene synthetase
MASIHRNVRAPKGVWYAVLRLTDGRRVWRSTKTRDRTRVKIIADAWQAAEDAAASAELSGDRVLEILNETLKRIGAESIEFVSVKSWLREWLGSKEGQIADSTHRAYAQAVETKKEILCKLAQRRWLQSRSLKSKSH